MSKDKLQWITISSQQAILMSVCLQSMVDQLLLKRNECHRQSTMSNKGNWIYMKRDGSSHQISLEDPNIYPFTVSSKYFKFVQLHICHYN